MEGSSFVVGTSRGPRNCMTMTQKSTKPEKRYKTGTGGFDVFLSCIGYDRSFEDEERPTNHAERDCASLLLSEASFSSPQ